MGKKQGLHVVNPPGRMVIIFIFILLAFILACCPPTQPCDKKIKDPAVYEKIALSDSVIARINSVLILRKVDIAKCVVNQTIGINIWYNLPASFSEFDITYSDYLNLSYSLEGNFTVVNALTSPPDFTAETILSYFKSGIEEIESNPRVREVIQKTDRDPLNPVLPLFGQFEIMRSGSNRVEYNYYSHSVRGYLLSNDVDWQEFPEIKQAHQIIQNYLLVGDLSECKIGHGEMHAYTATEFHDDPNGPWNMTVALICGDRWKDAFVKINPDGSYEQLKISSEY